MSSRRGDGFNPHRDCVGQAVETVRVAVDVRARPAAAPRQARARARRASCGWAPTPAAGYTDERDPAARTRPRSSTSSARSPSARSTSARTRSRTRGSTPASARATASRSCAATTAASSRPPSRRRSSARTRLYLNTAFAGPQLTEVVQREKPTAIVYDQEFTELLEDAGKRRKRFVAWVDDDSPPDPTLEELIESGDTERAGAARRARPRRDPHLGHDRHAEGRGAQAARRRSARRSRSCRASR